MIKRNKEHQSLLSGLFAVITLGSVIFIDLIYVYSTKKDGV